MSLRRIRRGELLLLVAVIALVVSSRFPWFGIEVPAGRDEVVRVDGRNGLAPLAAPWLELVVLAGLSWLATVALAVRAGAGRATYGAVTAGVVAFFVTLLALLATALRALVFAPGLFRVAHEGLTFSISTNDFDAIAITRTAGTWIGLGALVLGLVGVWMALADDRARAAESRAVAAPPARDVPPLRPDAPAPDLRPTS